MLEILGFVGLFLLSAGIVVRSGLVLAQAGDVVAEKTGLGRLFVGTIFLAIATSLPELVTNISAVRLGAPNLAAGNILGANMINIVVLASLTSLFSPAIAPLSLDQRILGFSALILTGLAILNIVYPFEVGFLGLATLFIIVIYLASMYLIYRTREGGKGKEKEETTMPLKKAWILMGLAALGIILGAPALAFSADRLSELLGISGTFIGVLAVALVTTMPETSVTLGSLRLGAEEMAMGNVYGSCAFNVFILALADLAYPKNLYAALGRAEILAGIGALVLMTLGLFFLKLGSEKRTWASRGLAFLILAGWVTALFFVFTAQAP